MSPRGSEARVTISSEPVGSPLSVLVLARVLCASGATRAEIVRDLAPLAAHRLSPGEWRASADEIVYTLVVQGLATESRARLTVTEAGASVVAADLGVEPGVALGWPEMRDVVLIARALGVTGESLARKRALADPDVLRTFILQRAYGLKGKRTVPAAKLRAQLAVVALERAFGNKIKAGVGKGERLPSKAARALAAQLSKSPREFTTDQKLIAHLAAEHAGALQPEPDALRAAILKQFVSALFDAVPMEQPSARTKAAVAPSPSTPGMPAAANDREPRAEGRPPPRPDLADFAAAVHRAAAVRAQGWPARAFICHVWDVIAAEHAHWSLSEVEFKAMLAEAHRHGAVKLVTADLKNKSIEFQRSETPFGANTVMHYVRVED